jgi:Flp pilus assembly protein TadG
MPLPGRLILVFRSPRFRPVRDFVRDERGATAVEFAILAIPFFGLVCAIMQTALVFLASQILDSAVQDASRLVRTGQAQNASFDIGMFNTQICNGLAGIFDCTKLETSVTTVSTFAAATVTPPVDPRTGVWTLVPVFQPGTANNVELVQVYYKWPVLFTFDGLSLATSSDNTHLLSAVRVFENEPFS